MMKKWHKIDKIDEKNIKLIKNVQMHTKFINEYTNTQIYIV